MTDGASATVLTKSNSVLIVETPENMEKLRSLVRLLDTQGQEGVGLSRLTNAKILTVQQS